MLTDFTLAVRSWLKTPRLTLTLLACIAVSIGGTATVLTFAHSLLLRPPPFPEPDRLVLVEPAGSRDRLQGERPYLSYPNFADVRAATNSFELFAGATVTRLVVLTPGGAERLRGETVTPGYFELFGVQPRQGRLFTDEEYAGRGDRVILLSSRLWKSRFASDPVLVGSTIATRSGPMVVAGILPDGWLGVAENEGTDYWIAERQNLHPGMLESRADPTTVVFGRLKSGTSVAQADAEMTALLAGLARAHPEPNGDLAARVVAFAENWRSSLRGGLVTMLFGSLFLLVIGCANVAILLLARLVTREREFAVRLSLGAGRRELLRLLFAESLVLALAGGAAGFLLAAWLRDLFVRLAGEVIPFQLPVVFGPTPLLLCAAVVLATGFAFGLLPALAASRIDPAAALRAGGRGVAAGALQGRGGRALVIGQTALAVALLAGAALFVRNYEKLRYMDFGYRTDSLLRYQVTLQRESYPSREALGAWWRDLLPELQALPGVRAAGYFGPTIPPYDANEVELRLKGDTFSTPTGALRVYQHVGNNEAFSILGVPLREGRFFTPADRFGSPPVALISETLARRIAPVGSALGRVVTFENLECEVVGVVADARWTGHRNRNPSGLHLFLSLEQFPPQSAGLLLDTAVDPRALIEPVRRLVYSRDPAAAHHWITTMEQALDAQTINERFWAVLAAVYAGTAFLLAALGLYGVLAHGVAARKREIGIRMALGATAAGVARLIVGQGLRLVASGLVAGLALALALGRLLESRLHGTTPYDPLAFAAVTALLFLAATLICWLPARRAARVDPVVALRAE